MRTMRTMRTMIIAFRDEKEKKAILEALEDARNRLEDRLGGASHVPWE